MTESVYTTTDIYLASFLCYKGRVFQGCKRLKPKKVEFRFATGRELHDLLRLYWSCQPILIEPALVFASLHQLRCLSITRR